MGGAGGCPRINNTTCVLLKKWHQGVSFSSRGNLWLLTAPRPGAVKGRRPPKRCFVLINDHRAFIPGVFFRRIHRFCFLGSACTKRVLGRCTEKFNPLSKWRTCPE